MDVESLRQQLMIDEGYSNTPYKDSLGYLTVGIGHLVQPSDKITSADVLSHERIMDLFNHDIVHAEIGCRALFSNYDKLPEKVQHVLVNMCFNLGPQGLAGFKRFRAAIEREDYKTACFEMQDSDWYTQVGARARRLLNKLMEMAYTGKVE